MPNNWQRGMSETNFYILCIYPKTIQLTHFIVHGSK